MSLNEDLQNRDILYMIKQMILLKYKKVTRFNTNDFFINYLINFFKNCF